MKNNDYNYTAKILSCNKDYVDINIEVRGLVNYNN